MSFNFFSNNLKVRKAFPACRLDENGQDARPSSVLFAGPRSKINLRGLVTSEFQIPASQRFKIAIQIFISNFL